VTSAGPATTRATSLTRRSVQRRKPASDAGVRRSRDALPVPTSEPTDAGNSMISPGIGNRHKICANFRVRRPCLFRLALPRSRSGCSLSAGGFRPISAIGCCRMPWRAWRSGRSWCPRADRGLYRPLEGKNVTVWPSVSGVTNWQHLDLPNVGGDQLDVVDGRIVHPPHTLAAIINGTGPHDATVTALAQAVPYRWEGSAAGRVSEQSSCGGR
jgi:hypothetical protein